MSHSKQDSIGQNIDTLTKLTKNLTDILERLQDYDVLTASEIREIECCSDEESGITMLYLMIANKPLSNFDLLLYVLRDTDNEMLAKLLEQSFKSGDTNSTTFQPEKYVSPDPSNQNRISQHAGPVLISRGEMGIAEILEDYEKLNGNWKLLSNMLRLPTSYTSGYSTGKSFVVQATLILRDWVEHLKKGATVDNLCTILDHEGFDHCAARIRRMFDRYVDSGFGFDFPGSFSIKGKITVIASILDNNPSFSFHPERLLLMLNLPLGSLSELLQDSKFPKIAEKMLTRWSDQNSNSASPDHLASLLALNGHFHTCDKISAL